jgi:hypothetical protein
MLFLPRKLVLTLLAVSLQLPPYTNKDLRSQCGITLFEKIFIREEVLTSSWEVSGRMNSKTEQKGLSKGNCDKEMSRVLRATKRACNWQDQISSAWLRNERPTDELLQLRKEIVVPFTTKSQEIRRPRM